MPTLHERCDALNEHHTLSAPNLSSRDAAIAGTPAKRWPCVVGDEPLQSGPVGGRVASPDLDRTLKTFLVWKVWDNKNRGRPSSERHPKGASAERMRILITGGTGFIASFFVEALHAQGHQLSLLDLWMPEKDMEGVTFLRGDVRDPIAVEEALRGCDAVLHLAAAHHDFGIEPDTYFSVNRGGTRTLCEQMKKEGVSELCFFSSVAVYGPDGNHDESEKPEPQNPYGASKFAAEKVLNEWVSEDPRRACLNLRPAMTFGPGNFANMFKLIRQIDSGRFYPVGRGSNKKSMAFVTNLVEATLHLWPKADCGVRVLNYADKPDMSSRDIVRAIYHALGKKPPPGFLPLGPTLWAARVLDRVSAVFGQTPAISSQAAEKFAGIQSVFPSDRIESAGFHPGVSLQGGIQRTVDWYRTVPGGRAMARIPPAEVQVFR